MQSILINSLISIWPVLQKEGIVNLVSRISTIRTWLKSIVRQIIMRIENNQKRIVIWWINMVINQNINFNHWIRLSKFKWRKFWRMRIIQMNTSQTFTIKLIKTKNFHLPRDDHQLMAMKPSSPWSLMVIFLSLLRSPLSVQKGQLSTKLCCSMKNRSKTLNKSIEITVSISKFKITIA